MKVKLKYLISLSCIFVLLTVAMLLVGHRYFEGDLSSKKEIKALIKGNFPSLYKEALHFIHENNKDVKGIGEKLHLPVFKLLISRNDIAHFSDLYHQYETSGNGMEYYKDHNIWRKAELEYDNKVYKIKIKAHGRQPNYHRSGRHISFAIKMKKGEHIRNTRRFSLIIRERIRLERHLVLDLADRFNLIRNEDELVRIKINNWEEKLYYLEPRFDNAFMESQKLSSFRIFKDSQQNDKSMILNVMPLGESDFDEDRFRQRFMNLKMMNDKEIAANYKNGILNRYSDFNKHIFTGNSDALGDYFDHEYISSFEAARLIAGCIGHGFSKGNFYIFLDTASGKFYPAFTRDNIPSQLKPTDTHPIELQVNLRLTKDLPPMDMQLFHLLAENEVIRHAKFRKIYDYVKKELVETPLRHREIVERNAGLHNFGVALLMLRKLGLNVYPDILSHNLKILRGYIESSNPKVNVSFSKQVLYLEIDPNSFASLQIRTLKIGCDNRASDSTLGAQLSGYEIYPDGTKFIGEERESIPISNGTIDLSGISKSFRFSNALDSKSSLRERKYFLKFTFHSGICQIRKSLDDLEIELVNSVTDALVENLSVNIVSEIKSPVTSGRGASLASDIELDDFMATNQNVKMSYNTALNQLTIQSGTYEIAQDFVLPRKTKLLIESGTTLLLGENVLVKSFDGIDVLGTAREPVTIKSKFLDKPFGSVGVLGDRSSTSRINYLILSGGNERWSDGAYFSGGLSIHYNQKVEISNTVIQSNHADDGLNVKYCEELNLRNSVLRGNFADQVDLDYCNGAVVDCDFVIDGNSDSNGDGLDVSGASVLVETCVFSGFRDKGISVGENSNVLVLRNDFSKNTNGIAVKDSSHVFLVDNIFVQNSTDINVYQKKSIYGGGVVYYSTPESGADPSYMLDRKSVFKEFPDPGIVNKIKATKEIDDLQNILVGILSHYE